MAVACFMAVSGWWWGCAQGPMRSGQDGGGDGDSATAQVDSGPDPTDCGDGVVDPGEACDDGNTSDGDDCRWDCLQDLTLCANGVVDLGEGCDDGNTVGGDGCSATCQLEGCSPANCAGCCDSGGVCQAGTQDTRCGAAGDPCQDCTGTGLACLGNTCQQLGSCTPGQQLECGNCGTMTCDAQGEWGPCENEGVCAENQIDMGGICGDCGVEERTCTAACQWGSWVCVGEGVCSQGQTDTGGVCGDCGVEERICTAACQWGSWSCVGEGVCSEGQTQVGGVCGGTGVEERTCLSTCQWGSWICIGGCPVSSHMSDGENGDPCSEAPETWRCAYSNNWGAYISQVCRNGNWLTCEINPPSCVDCCDSWSSDCGYCV